MNFKEFLQESKLTTSRGNKYNIDTVVKKASAFADSIGLTDSRLMAGTILDWCKENKVKFTDLESMVKSGEIDKKLAKGVFYRKDPFSARGSKSRDDVLEILRGIKKK